MKFYFLPALNFPTGWSDRIALVPANPSGIGFRLTPPEVTEYLAVTGLHALIFSAEALRLFGFLNLAYDATCSLPLDTISVLNLEAPFS